MLKARVEAGMATPLERDKQYGKDFKVYRLIRQGKETRERIARIKQAELAEQTAKLQSAPLSDQQHIDEILCETKLASYKRKKPVKKNNFFSAEPQEDERHDPQSLIGIWASRHKGCPNFDGP